MQLHHVVAADILDHPPAAAGQLAVGQRDADADEKVARRPVTHALRAGPPGGQQPAHGVSRRAERIEGQELAGLAELRLQRLERDAGLDAHDHVGLRVLDDAVEARGVEQHVATLERVAHAARPAAAERHDGEPRRCGVAQEARELLGARRLLRRWRLA